MHARGIGIAQAELKPVSPAAGAATLDLALGVAIP